MRIPTRNTTVPMPMITQRNASLRSDGVIESASNSMTEEKRNTMNVDTRAAKSPLPPSNKPKAIPCLPIPPTILVVRINADQNKKMVEKPQKPYNHRMEDGSGTKYKTRAPRAVNQSASDIN